MNTKKVFIFLAAVLIFLLMIFFHPVFAQEETEEETATAETAPPPPSGEGTVVAKHWSKYAYPETLPAGQSVHIIVKGDTLWDLAGKYLKNSYLWPKIWEANKYITNSHWIYPGDPLIIPGVQVVSDTDIAALDGAAAAADQQDISLYEFSESDLAGTDTGDEYGLEDTDFIDDIASIKPVAKYFDIHCYDTVLPDENMFDAAIISSEMETMNIRIGDYAYIDLGEDQNIKVGDIFSVMHRDHLRPVEHPESSKFLGWVYKNSGKIKVVMVFGDFAIVRVIEECRTIEVGDQIRPFKKLPVPLLEEQESISYYVEPSVRPTGFVIYSQDGRLILGKNSLGVVELGQSDGLELGDTLLLYRENSVPGLPRVPLGTAVVLVVEEDTAVFKVLQTRFEIMVGDLAEVR